MYEQVKERLRNLDVTPDTLQKAQFEESTTTPGSRSLLATYQADRLLSFDETTPLDLSIVAVETYTTDGNAGDAETFTATHGIEDSNAVPQNLVLYDGNVRVQPDSVDVAANEFTYTDPDANSTLTAFYTPSAQGLVTIEKVAPNGVSEQLFVGEVGSLHRRDTASNPLYFDFSHEWQPLVPKDFKVNVYVDAPYSAALTYDATDDGTETVAANALIDLPFRGASGPVEGVAEPVRVEGSRQ